MPKALNLVGKRFGNLVVLNKCDHKSNSGKVLWLCKCDCGGTIETATGNLTKGITTHCKECILKKKSTKYDYMIGNKYDSLTVLEYVGKSKFRCKCDCGNETIADGESLLNGRRKSCGKCKPEEDRKELIGKRFGKLTVTSFAYSKDNRLYWNCVCDCGNTCVVSGQRLRNGKTDDCGNHNTNIKDLTGMTFGELHVDSFAYTKDSLSYWNCTCSCGKKCVVCGKRLKNGTTTSCGHKKHEHRHKDITGKQFGYLVAKEYVYIKDGVTFWKFHCTHCGKDKLMRAYDVKSGKCYSCGCVNIAQRGSQSELYLYEYIKSLTNEEVVQHNRSVLGGKELDIYIPSEHLAIEYNGSVFHSVNNKLHCKDKEYHREKFLACKEKGVHLVSIFDVDWKKNSEKIKMYLKSLLVKNKVIYARKCIVRHITEEEANSFCDKYHIQGRTQKHFAFYNYGLFYNDKLYSVMIFGKPRLTKSESGEYELHRYCVKDGYTIVGGANKLHKAFIREYSPKYIRSYSDNDYFLGGIYSVLGYKFDSQSTPRYYWYLNGEEIKREHCQLKYLKKDYPDLFEEAINKNAGNKEVYIMDKLGAFQVWRCGNTKWIWAA